MKNTLNIALAQMNPVVGDIAGNAAAIMEYYTRAAKGGADLVVFPELCLIGYPPEDLVLMQALRAKAMAMVQELAGKTAGGAAMIIGCVWERGGRVFNAGLLLDHGKIEHVQPKTMLPNAGIFDEKRLFDAGDGPMAVKWRGVKLGMLVCEDVWHSSVPEALAHQGAEMIVVINASPFEAGKLSQRKKIVAEAVHFARIPLVYVNTVGAQDDIVFDGGSFVLSGDGQVVHQLPEFAQALEYVALNVTNGALKIVPQASGVRLPMLREETLWEAMKLGLKDYVHKNGFTGITLGLSGGIDSAITAALAVDALGAKNVTGVLLPSPYTSKESIDDAQLSAKLLGIKTMNIPITPGMNVFEEVLNPVFQEAGWMDNITIGGNLQARLRGVTLMAISNKFGWLLLSTGNKSEIAVGYSTLYGDSCGSFNVLKDLYKTQVYTLAVWRNSISEVIPARSITKAPSAELAPGQKDQDQLPPYDMLDGILAHHLEGQLAAEEIIAKGFAREMVEKILKLVRINEYKRRQSCPGVKLSSMLFGRDRRYPLTNKF